MSSAIPQSAPKVAVLVGSLRKESFSRKIARGIAQRAERRLRCTLLEIGDLPLYNEDLDGTPPAPWQRLRGEIRAADGVLGAFGANHAVRQSCVFLNMPVLQQPEMYLNAAEVLDDSGALKSGDTAAFVDKFVDAFAAWIARVGAARTQG